MSFRTQIVEAVNIGRASFGVVLHIGNDVVAPGNVVIAPAEVLLHLWNIQYKRRHELLHKPSDSSHSLHASAAIDRDICQIAACSSVTCNSGVGGVQPADDAMVIKLVINLVSAVNIVNRQAVGRVPLESAPESAPIHVIHAFLARVGVFPKGITLSTVHGECGAEVLGNRQIYTTRDRAHFVVPR